MRNCSVVFSMSAGTAEACTGRYVKLCLHFDDKHILRLYVSIVRKTEVKNVVSKQNY